MKPVRWWFWAVVAALLGVYTAGGFIWGQAAPANTMYDIAGITAFTGAVVFIATYTIAGLRGPAKWWTNDLGTSLVIAVAGIAAITGPITFAVLFNHGLINTVWWAWAEIGGTALAALAVLWLCWARIRTIRKAP